ncbi:MAG: hypothetical protein M0R77_14745 [Gammaproteobacteria bacterium]|nr:hypothetical protein [Gammaproteobacteria bacterium]
MKLSTTVTTLLAVVTLGTASLAFAQAGADMNEQMALMQKQVALMKPELQQKVKALSPETKKLLLQLLAQHTRYSDRVTFRQVMHEVLADYQSMVAGIVTENPEQAAEAARRLANHRMPRGGLLPYLKPEHINDAALSALLPFNETVEGNTLKLAEAAERGDMALATNYLTTITTGCVGCHQMFRGTPGLSDRLR